MGFRCLQSQSAESEYHEINMVVVLSVKSGRSKQEKPMKTNATTSNS